ncbi:hypothetical protein DFH08DRAFT_933348 [Mycena albidolilacea]|uniref:Uncharacterized protein n=1 Tax=Mycena albidolilacea TaxID=1033008 RepID=A0AAD7ACV7_9AGAR|nr:hypothetical protein DFH08DRAFT_933348 [Mycena albidolilacea]
MQLTLQYIALAVLGSFVACGNAFTFEKIDKNNSMLLVVDHQLGLFQLSTGATYWLTPPSAAEVFNLPTILTTSGEIGPNGPLPKEIVATYPNAPLIKRQCEVNAWDNADFQVIMAGIVTDVSPFDSPIALLLNKLSLQVCTTFLALSLVQEGYTLFANADASGAFNAQVAANDRMRAAGVNVVRWSCCLSSAHTFFVCLLATTRLSCPCSYLTQYGFLARGHAAAVTNGILFPGESA